MQNKKHHELVSRENLLKILSDEELARVRMKAHLTGGDEFIDLIQIENGVQRAKESNPTDVLPRKAVHENTWRKIVTHLGAWKVMTQPYVRATKQP